MFAAVFLVGESKPRGRRIELLNDGSHLRGPWGIAYSRFSFDDVVQ